jgi:DNA-binding NtrC family response regulator
MAKILIIDDDESIRELLIKILEKRDHEVIEAANGDIGLKIFNENKIDLVITDVIMEYSGINVIKEVNEKNKDIPIIAITGSLLSAAILQEDFSVAQTLVKPFNKETLLNTVDQVLKNH